MTDITAVLRAVAPRANPAFVQASADLGAIMASYGITSPTAQAMVIAQTAHECAGYTVFQEGLSYSAGRLCQVWPSRFPTIAAAEPFARNPKALANKVYNGRMGNRLNSDDGWNYRGSGPLQHTGASEFKRVEKRTQIPVTSDPDMLRNPIHATAMWKAACSYFVDRGALQAASNGQVRETTIRVNGGTIGLKDREILFSRAMAALDGQPLPAGRTTLEQADDAKRRARQAGTAAAPVGTGTGGAAKQGGGTDASTAVYIGLGVVLALVVIAGIFWQRHKAKVAAVEKMQLQSINARIALAQA